MAKQSRRRRSKKRRSDFFKKQKWPLLLLAGAGIAMIALVFFAEMVERPGVPTGPPTGPPTEPPRTDYSTRMYAEVEAFFSELELDKGNIQRDRDVIPATYTVTTTFPKKELLETFAARLKKISSSYSLFVQGQNNALLVDKEGHLQLKILFIPPVPDTPDGPLVTIIMDDLGRSTSVAEALVALAEPVTFSILPGEANAAEVAEIGYASGHEIMLHVPMEPQGYPAVNPGDDALFVKYSSEEIRIRFDQFLLQVPHVSGTNNHMGSRFTEDSRALAPVMKSLQEKGLFFVDSRTTGGTKVTETALKYGVPTLSRDVFLDNVADVAAIAKEIRRLENRARKQGQAIGICHPYPETLEALRQELPKLSEQGVTVVPVSVLLRKQAIPHGS